MNPCRSLTFSNRYNLGPFRYRNILGCPQQLYSRHNQCPELRRLFLPIHNNWKISFLNAILILPIYFELCDLTCLYDCLFDLCVIELSCHLHHRSLIQRDISVERNSF